MKHVQYSFLQYQYILLSDDLLLLWCEECYHEVNRGGQGLFHLGTHD